MTAAIKVLIAYSEVTGYALAGWEALAARLAEWWLARRASFCVLSWSQVMDGRFARLAPATPRIRVWPPVDIEVFGGPQNGYPKRDPSGACSIAYAGALSWLEGIPVLLEAFALVRKVRMDCTLILAGREVRDDVFGMPIDVRKMMEDLDIRQSVKLVGVLSEAGVAHLLQRADVLVIPKIDHPANHHAAPIKLGEYLASGRPVVVSRTGGVDQFVRDGIDAVLFEPGDACQLAEAILSLLTDSEKASQIGKSGAGVAARECSKERWCNSFLEACRQWL
jgi:glycosyltransferase involved in cell wall biosynthesis